MKHVQLAIVFVSLLFTAFGTLQAQCTTDSAFTTPGYYPSGTLPPATVGVAYDQTISIVLPRDTSVTVNVGAPLTISASFCEINLVGISGLPEGLSYECDNADCSFVVDHSIEDPSRGCVRIFGTPTDTTATGDSIRMTVEIVPGYIDSTDNNRCDNDSLRNELGGFYSLIQAFLTQDVRFEFDVATDIEGRLNREQLAFRLYPNPTEDLARLRFTLPDRNAVRVSLHDMLGREIRVVHDGNMMPGTQTLSVDTRDFPTGVYLLRLRNADGRIDVTERLTVR